MKKLIALSLLAAAAGPNAHSELIINEIMQSNIDCIMDDLNEFPDSWVELYNDGTSPVNLSGYALGDETSPSKAFKLPARTIPAKGFVVIYCDKEGSNLHTDFRLDSGKGGAVYLFKGDEIIDKIENWKKQPAPNIAYGRTTEASTSWGYQADPTPGAKNCGKVYKDILGAPVFSQAGRVASTPLSLSISVPDGSPAGTVVRYTTDGTEPTATSKQFSTPLQISSTQTIRAKLFCDGYLSPRSTTHSYIFQPREMTVPILSIVTDSKYFYDAKLGIYVEGNNQSDPNYKHDWRRPVNLEMFEAEGAGSVINQLCETRVKGGASRDFKLKSLVMYANKRFGTKRFEHEFFPEDAPGLTDWKSFELRNAGNDFDYLYFRDAAIQRMMGRHADLDWQPWQPAVVYINGTYLGMLNIRSRTNEDYVYTLYDGEEDIDLIENWWELKEGSWDNFNAFTSFYSEKGHTLEEFEKWMDTSEFANLMIMDLYYDNKDFPGNNIVCWRPIADGGRWRWIAKDTDFGLGLYGATPEYKTFNWLYDNNYDSDRAWANRPEHTRLFRRLMDIPEFKDMFVDRCAVYMADFMNSRGTEKELDAMYALIKNEYPHHRALINQWWPVYSDELTWAKTWVRQRTPFFYSHLAEFYQLGTPHNVTIDAGHKDDIALTVNGIKLHNRDYTGQYFEGKTLNVTAEAADPTKTVTGWKVITTNGSASSVATYEGGELKLTIPQCTALAITSIMGQSGIERPEIDADGAFDPEKEMTVVDLNGRTAGTFSSLEECHRQLQPGLYIIRQGHVAIKYVIK